MHRNLSTFLLIFILNTILFSQENFIRNYQISINGTTQKISVSKLNNNKYEGYIISYAYKYKEKHYTEFKNKKDLSYIRDKLKTITDSVKINPKKVLKLIRKLKSKGIEQLKEDKGNYIVYNGEEIVFFSDYGNPTLFEINTKKSEKKIIFHSLNYKVEKEYIVLNKQRIKAQKLYNTLITEIDFNKYWKEFNSKYEISEYNDLIKPRGYDLPKLELNLIINMAF